MGWDWRRAVKPLADKIVYASEPYVSLKSSVNDLAGSLIDFSRPVSGDGDRALIAVACYLRPWTAPELDLIRVGGGHDGGYVMHNDFSVRGAISVGVGRDISWDVGMVEHGVSVNAFDHTVRGLPERVEGVSFHKVGLGSGSHCISLQEMARMTTSDADAIVKIDIEGAEWTALEDADFDQFTQVLLELHQLDLVATDERLLSLLQRLYETHVPVHVHANNYDTVFRQENLWFCRALEVTFVRRDASNSWRPADSMREDLDRPCDPRASDICLRGLLSLDPA